jgi:hypothetical protein
MNSSSINSYGQLRIVAFPRYSVLLMVSDVSAKVERLVVSASNRHVVSHHVSLAWPCTRVFLLQNVWGRRWLEGVSKTQALLSNPGTRLMCLKETLKRGLDVMFSAVMA